MLFDLFSVSAERKNKLQINIELKTPFRTNQCRHEYQFLESIHNDILTEKTEHMN